MFISYTLQAFCLQNRHNIDMRFALGVSRAGYFTVDYWLITQTAAFIPLLGFYLRFLTWFSLNGLHVAYPYPRGRRRTMTLHSILLITSALVTYTNWPHSYYLLIHFQVPLEYKALDLPIDNKKMNTLNSQRIAPERTVSTRLSIYVYITDLLQCLLRYSSYYIIRFCGLLSDGRGDP